nr:HAD-IA family hydrolase [Cytophagales bacterium]
MITDILFDNDGVLVNTEPLFYEASKAVLSSVGIDLSWDDFEELSLVQGQNIVRVMAADRIDEQGVAVLLTRRDQLYQASLSQADLSNPDIKDAVVKLSAKFRLSIVTGSLRAHFETVHKNTGLLSHFHTVVTDEDFEQPKPHPDPYLIALQRLNVRPENCIAIEDSERGLRSSTSAGIRTVMIGKFRSPIKGAAAICETPDRLYDQIMLLSSSTNPEPEP